MAKKHNLNTGDVILINDDIEIPVLIQPGQAENTISLTAGYGRSNSGRIANGVGVNVNHLYTDIWANSFSMPFKKRRSL